MKTLVAVLALMGVIAVAVRWAVRGMDREASEIRQLTRNVRQTAEDTRVISGWFERQSHSRTNRSR